MKKLTAIKIGIVVFVLALSAVVGVQIARAEPMSPSCFPFPTFRSVICPPSDSKDGGIYFLPLIIK